MVAGLQTVIWFTKDSFIDVYGVCEISLDNHSLKHFEQRPRLSPGLHFGTEKLIIFFERCRLANTDLCQD